MVVMVVVNLMVMILRRREFEAILLLKERENGERGVLMLSWSQ